MLKPAAIGVLMAYFVSFLGLLPAYYSYKKHGPGAEKPNKDSNPGGQNNAG